MQFKICGEGMLGFGILVMKGHQQDEELPLWISAWQHKPPSFLLSSFCLNTLFHLHQNSTLPLPILSFHSAEEDFTNGLFSLQDAWIWVGVWIWVGALDCGGGFGLCGCFLVWVGACFLLEIFAGSVSLSFLTRLQVGVLDLVM